MVEVEECSQAKVFMNSTKVPTKYIAKIMFSKILFCELVLNSCRFPLKTYFSDGNCVQDGQEKIGGSILKSKVKI